MPYVTIPASIRYHQMTLEEVLDAPPGSMPRPPVGKLGDTRTVFYEVLPDRLKNPFIATHLISILHGFLDKYQTLYEKNRQELYRSFKIPKASGGWRQIDAPKYELMEALSELKDIFQREFHASHHTSAFAYATHRCTIDAVKRHQSNQSNWFLKTDCSDFFGATTPEFTEAMLRQIWPFNLVYAIPQGCEALTKALDLGFLNGGLPQGTPLSPLLTNLIMIPIDHSLFHKLRDYDGQSMVYTRYADDVHISARKHFDWRGVIQMLEETFVEFGAPYEIKPQKTHYGSASGRNWILGVMYNRDHQITIGHRKKQIFRTMLNEYLLRHPREDKWEYHAVQELQGIIAYYKKVEPAYMEYCLNRYGEKYGVNVMRTIRDDLRG